MKVSMYQKSILMERQSHKNNLHFMEWCEQNVLEAERISQVIMTNMSNKGSMIKKGRITAMSSLGIAQRVAQRHAADSPWQASHSDFRGEPPHSEERAPG